MSVIEATCLSCLAFISGDVLKCVLTSGSALISRYFYRACQGTLFPNPVQVARELDKLPAETRKNIFSLSRVKKGSPLSPRSPVMSLSKQSTKGSNKKDQGSNPGPTASRSEQGPFLQTDGEKIHRGQSASAHNAKHLSDLYSLLSTESDTLPYTKDTSLLAGQPQPPYTKDSECFDKTLEPSDLSLSSWITTTPLARQVDKVQLNLPPDAASESVKYTRSREDGLRSDHTVHPAHRTVQVAEQSLHITS